MKYFTKIAEKLEDLGINSKGISIKQIEEIQSNLGVEFPLIYKEFLQLFGNESEVLFCGDTIQTRHLNFIQEVGRKAYKDAIGIECPINIFFILEHQGYSFYYFFLDGTENPGLYLLIYGDEITNKRTGNLIDLVERKISLVDGKYKT